MSRRRRDVKVVVVNNGNGPRWKIRGKEIWERFLCLIIGLILGLVLSK